MKNISHEDLLKVIHYSQETGEFRWKVRQSLAVPAGSIAGTIGKSGRRMIQINGDIFVAARLAWLYVHGSWPSQQIDHKNLNRSDDRIDNLREASPVENAQNRRKKSNNTSGFKGVHWVAHANKWQSRISVNGNRINLGLYSDIKDAAAAYAKAAKFYYGEFFRQ